MGWQYSEKTKKLFMDAIQGKSGTHVGELENADGVGEHGSVACGDALKFMFRVERDPEDPLKDKIVEARFLTFGCTSAIAASEALCRIIEERELTPIESLKVTNQDIVDYLEGLPTQKIHCSVMGAEALETAVFDWAKKRGVDMDALGIKQLNVDEHEGRIVCSCFGITEPYLRRKIRELKLRTVDEVTGAIKAGGACGACRGEIQEIINETLSAESAESREQESDAVNVVSSANSQSAKAPADAGFAPLPLVSATSQGDDVQNPTLASKDAEENSFVDPQEEYANASPYQRAKLVERTIEEEVRPILQRDGGDLEIVDIKDNLIYVTFTGACDGCDSAALTLDMYVSTTLQTLLDPNIEVVLV
ncbi:MAG: iron-sulfur cluster assembly scaffold protein [Thermoguttaceae bacterium]|jgi:NifU-like protein